MAAKSTPELSPLELEVMNVIWELGECTSADVIDRFTKKRKLANTTIRTVLANIRKKGYLDVVPSVEPRVRFKPRVSKRSVARRNVRQLLANMFGDSPREAITGKVAAARKIGQGSFRLHIAPTLGEHVQYAVLAQEIAMQLLLRSTRTRDDLSNHRFGQSNVAKPRLPLHGNG